MDLLILVSVHTVCVCMCGVYSSACFAMCRLHVVCLHPAKGLLTLVLSEKDEGALFSDAPSQTPRAELGLREGTLAPRLTH